MKIKMLVWGACITAGISLAACASHVPSANKLDTVAEAATIDQAREAFMDAMAEKDFETLGAISHPDFIQVLPGGPDHLIMYASATEGPFPPGYRLDITPKELVIINEEWAYELGTTVMSYQSQGSEKPTKIQNTYLMLLRKHEGAWKPYREVASALPPPEGWPE